MQSTPKAKMEEAIARRIFFQSAEQHHAVPLSTSKVMSAAIMSLLLANNWRPMGSIHSKTRIMRDHELSQTHERNTDSPA